MQGRRQLPFILALVGAIFSLGMTVMMLIMSTVLFGAMPMPMDGAEFMLGIFGWFAVMGLLGGVGMAVGAARLRGPDARSGALWSIVGGALAVLGGNLIAAALGIVAGSLVLSEPSA